MMKERYGYTSDQSRSAGEERSDEAAERGAAETPDPEVLAKPTRRQFTAAYRLRVLEEADRCQSPGDLGRLLRREGLYSSHLANWRKARREGALWALSPRKRGVKPKPQNPLEPKVRALEAKVERLQADLHKAQTIIDVQGKVAGLLGLNFRNERSS